MLHVIHDAARHDRAQLLTASMAGIDHQLWPAVQAQDFATGCAQAHASIAAHAASQGWPQVSIAEDDLQWSALGAWQYYCAAAQDLPADWDLYLGGISSGTPWPTAPGLRLQRLVAFTGLHLYSVSQKCYTLLSGCPPRQHLDRWLSSQRLQIYVCHPMVARQASGYSANKGQVVDYTALFAAYEFWSRT